MIVKGQSQKTGNDSESIRQNLIDAGCDKEFIDRFMEMDLDTQKKEVLAMLARQRNFLLDGIHSDERKIYCLDFLVNKLKNL